MSTDQKTESAIELVIQPDIKDLGEFVVKRTLPSTGRQRVGPFIFFDHMGPVDFPPGSGVSVRPHPHIGLATLTYLFAGEIVHRDSLGYVQAIQSGAVNWMTAGRGIVHSERSSEELTASGSHLHGLQTWLALPTELEETDPGFAHYAADDVPVVEMDGVVIHVVVGEAFGERSPVATSSETLYLEVDIAAGAELALAFEVDEKAVYVVEGEIRIGEETLGVGTMAVLSPSVAGRMTALENSKVMVLGGATLPGKRYLYWNLVSSSRERIQQAKDDWRNNRFDPVPGETEFIPLPKD